jgi:glycosyltransferase involved in cell wall biosynthesis
MSKPVPATYFGGGEAFMSEASFWRPRWLVDSAWLEHGPFAFWLIEQIRPRTLVELGTHHGFSYFCFCQAIRALNLPTRCWAVDTWEGDSHTGPYQNNVFLEANRHNDAHYKDFSTLLPGTFDQARARFGAGEIDLLHIDGFHSYEAVRRDFETWLPAMTGDGVILLHDTNVRTDDFGVWKFWDEISREFRTFPFLHGNGLGVVCLGDSSEGALRRLCGAPNRTRSAARRFYRVMGRAIQTSRLLVNSDNHARTIYFASLAHSHEEDIRKAVAKRHEGEVRRLQFAIETMRKSLSWKLTAPLRAADRLLSKAAEAFRPKPAPPGTSPANGIPAPDPFPGLPAQPSSRLCDFPEEAAKSGRPIIGYISGEPNTPGHTYRVERAISALHAAGFRAWHATAKEAAENPDAVRACSVLIFWRCPFTRELDASLIAGREAGARVLYDIDDLMFEPEIAKTGIIDGIRTQNLTEDDVAGYYKLIHSAFWKSEACLCTTEFLASKSRAAGKPAVVIPNGFDERTFLASRLEARKRRASAGDGLLRIGYAGGSPTHQKDFALAADAVASVLRDHGHARLVLFRNAATGAPLVDLSEFPVFAGLGDRVEWRASVALGELPSEIARFDINLAPLETGNPFCEAKSELKFFEAALVDVPTVASPTGAFAGAIEHGQTGFLAGDPGAWEGALRSLLGDSSLRERVAADALRSVLWKYGPLRRSDEMGILMQQLVGPDHGAKAFASFAFRHASPHSRRPAISDTEIIFAHDALGVAGLTVVVPVFNYEDYVELALESVKNQTLEQLDLVIVDDASTDRSLERVVHWAGVHRERFNRLHVLRNRTNSRLARTRNAGFDFAQTLWVLPLDADNTLRKNCAEVCLREARAGGAAYVYPVLQQFGDDSEWMGMETYLPLRFCGSNFIDAMACVSKEAWALAGGYAQPAIQGWEDYLFWCRLAELGLGGRAIGGDPLATYRVHHSSMLRKETMAGNNQAELTAEIVRTHPWLRPTIHSGAEKTKK